MRGRLRGAGGGIVGLICRGRGGLLETRVLPLVCLAVATESTQGFSPPIHFFAHKTPSADRPSNLLMVPYIPTSKCFRLLTTTLQLL